MFDDSKSLLSTENWTLSCLSLSLLASLDAYSFESTFGELGCDTELRNLPIACLSDSSSFLRFFACARLLLPLFFSFSELCPLHRFYPFDLYQINTEWNIELSKRENKSHLFSLLWVWCVHADFKLPNKCTFAIERS